MLLGCYDLTSVVDTGWPGLSHLRVGASLQPDRTLRASVGLTLFPPHPVVHLGSDRPCLLRRRARWAWGSPSVHPLRTRGVAPSDTSCSQHHRAVPASHAVAIAAPWWGPLQTTRTRPRFTPHFHVAVPSPAGVNRQLCHRKPCFHLRRGRGSHLGACRVLIHAQRGGCGPRPRFPRPRLPVYH